MQSYNHSQREISRGSMFWQKGSTSGKGALLQAPPHHSPTLSSSSSNWWREIVLSPLFSGSYSTMATCNQKKIRTPKRALLLRGQKYRKIGLTDVKNTYPTLCVTNWKRKWWHTHVPIARHSNAQFEQLQAHHSFHTREINHWTIRNSHTDMYPTWCQYNDIIYNCNHYRNNFFIYWLEMRSCTHSHITERRLEVEPILW